MFRDDMLPAPAPVELEANDNVVMSWETNGRDWLLKVYTVDGSENLRTLGFGAGTLDAAQSQLDRMIG